MVPVPRILIVEDDEIISNLITTMLEHMGYSVVGKTGSGEESILKSAKLETDLVLMGIHLSGQMNGITAAPVPLQPLPLPDCLHVCIL